MDALWITLFSFPFWLSTYRSVLQGLPGVGRPAKAQSEDAIDSVLKLFDVQLRHGVSHELYTPTQRTQGKDCAMHVLTALDLQFDALDRRNASCTFFDTGEWIGTLAKSVTFALNTEKFFKGCEPLKNFSCEAALTLFARKIAFE